MAQFKIGKIIWKGVIKTEVKCNLEQATKAREGVQVWLYSFFNLGDR